MDEPTKVETLAEVVRDELRKACSQFIGQVDRNSSAVLADLIFEKLATAGQIGLIPDFQDVQFEVEADPQDPTHLILRPVDFYSALAIQFLRGGISGCDRLPPKSLIGSSWIDPAGNVWRFEGGQLVVQMACPIKFIKMTFEVEPEK